MPQKVDLAVLSSMSRYHLFSIEIWDNKIASGILTMYTINLLTLFPIV